MKVSVNHILNKIKKRSEERRRTIAVIMTLSVIISSCVIWGLRSTGITLVNDTTCGLEEHQHDESCYEKVLVCDITDDVISDETEEITEHIHSEDCYKEFLICEKDEHIHSVECYDNSEGFVIEEEENQIIDISDVCIVAETEAEEVIESDSAEKYQFFFNNDIMLMDIADSSYEPLYDEIYYIKDNQENSFAAGSGTKEKPFIIVKGETVNLGINEIYKTGEDWYFWIPDESENFIGFSDTQKAEFWYKENNNWKVIDSENKNYYENITRKTEAVFTALEKTESCNVVYNGKLVYFKIIESFPENQFYLKNFNGNYSLNGKGTDNNPYVMTEGSIINLAISHKYKEGDSLHYIWSNYSTLNLQSSNEKYISFIKREDQFENIYDGNTKIRENTAQIKAEKTTDNDLCIVEFETNDPQNKYLKFYIKIIKKGANRINVVTAVGDRDKDNINEFLASVQSWLNPDNLTDDRLYIKNSERWSYILDINETVSLKVFKSSGASDYKFSSDAGVVSLINEDNTNADFITATYKASGTNTGKQKISCSYKIGNTTYTDDFWIYVMDNDYQDPYNAESFKTYYDHADVEIADGGFYDLEEVFTDTDGVNKIRVRRYNSFITGINSCKLFRNENWTDPVNPGNNASGVIYVNEDYEENGVPGGSQYELTAKYKCSDLSKTDKHFRRGEVESAEFDVKLLLKPSVEIIYSMDSDNNKLAELKNTDISDMTGESDIVISSVVFKMDHRSVIDAHNKCPDHSGLDFNISAYLNNVINISPLKIPLNINKKINGGTSGLTDNAYKFELVDQNGKILKTAYNKADGTVLFEPYFMNEGTYICNVREVIPNDAVPYKSGESPYKNGVLYDSHTGEIKITVTGKWINGNYILEYSSPVYTNTDFNNIFSPEKSTKIYVEKIWEDENADHSSDNIKFSIYRRETGESQKTLLNINGQSEFMLDKSNNWKISFENIIQHIAGHDYEYSVEEINIPAHYNVAYSAVNVSDGLKFSITNKLIRNTALNVHKKWVNPDNSTVSNPPLDSVQVDLKRNRIKVVPVKIKIFNTENNSIMNELIADAYTGNNLEFELNIYDEGFISIDSCENCNCSVSDGRFTVSDINEGAVIKLNYSEIHITFDGNINSVSSSNSTIGAAYSTRYAGDNDGIKALYIRDRTASYSGAVISLDSSKFKKGNTYLFSAYVYMVNNNGEIPKLTFCNTWLGTNITESVDVWQHAVGKRQINFDITECKLLIETNADNKVGENFSDMYVDEIIISPDGMNVSVERGTGIVNHTDFELKNVNAGQMPAWTFDYSFCKSFDINRSEGWNKNFTGSELNESEYYIYQYYVEEKTSVPGFSVSYSADKISCNTPDNPILIINEAILYKLPETGGLGREKIFISGISLSGVALLLLTLKQKSKK